MGKIPKESDVLGKKKTGKPKLKIKSKEGVLKGKIGSLPGPFDSSKVKSQEEAQAVFGNEEGIDESTAAKGAQFFWLDPANAELLAGASQRRAAQRSKHQ